MQQKTKMEAEEMFDVILKTIIVPILGNKTTSSSDLTQMGRLLFDKKYVGTFPADDIPVLFEHRPYAIVNLDLHDQPGSHWLALAWASDTSTYVYDSFGRSTKSILPLLLQKSTPIDTEDDAEQCISETNCGARSMAFLLLHDKFGWNFSQWA